MLYGLCGSPVLEVYAELFLPMLLSSLYWLVWVGILDVEVNGVHPKVQPNCQGRRRQMSTRTVPGKALLAVGFATATVSSDTGCHVHCLQDIRCLSINYECGAKFGRKVCQLNEASEYEGVILMYNSSMCYAEIVGAELHERLRLKHMRQQVRACVVQ
jgi:hypothetical protein